MVKLFGTDLEALLTWAASGTTGYARVHICTPDCGQDSEGPGLLHCKKHRGIRTLEEIRDLLWRDVLVSAGRREEDELAGLRGRMEDLPAPAGADPGAEDRPKEEDREVQDKEKKKKKKSKKKKKRARSPSSTSQSSSTSSEAKHKAVKQKVGRA